jgi:hypothetical protein
MKITNRKFIYKIKNKKFFILFKFSFTCSNILTVDTNKNNLIIQPENANKIDQYSLANLLLSQNIDKKI